MTTHHQQIDDLDAYIADYDEAERAELAAAEFAIELAVLLHRARENRSLSQDAAAKLLGLTQQSVSRIEQPQSNVTLGTVSKYLSALGYDLELLLREPDSGEIVASAKLDSVAAAEVP